MKELAKCGMGELCKRVAYNSDMKAEQELAIRIERNDFSERKPLIVKIGEICENVNRMLR